MAFGDGMAEAAEKPSGIMGQLEQLANAIQGTEKAIDVLRQRLDPVMVPREPDPETVDAEKVERQQSRVAAAFVALTRQVDAQRKQLAELALRLEL